MSLLRSVTRKGVFGARWLFLYSHKSDPRVLLRPYVVNERKICGTQIEKSKVGPENSWFWSEKINDVEVVRLVSELLRRGDDWDWLSGKLDHIRLTDSIVEDILLQLKEPSDAKKGLSFFHWSSVRKKFDHSVRSYCILAQILFHARLDTHAKVMLESAARKNSYRESPFRLEESLLSTYAVTCSSPQLFDHLIQTYAKLRMFHEAISSYHYLQEHGFLPSIATWNMLLNVVQRSDKNLLIWRIYEDMITKKTFPNAVTSRIMVDAMCKQGLLQKTIDLLDKISSKRCLPGVIVNSALIVRMIEDDRVDEGILLLKRMYRKNMVTDNVTYSLIIFGLCKLGIMEHALAMHDEMLKRGYPANSLTYTSLIGVHCKDGRFQEFDQLVQEMVKQGLVPYNETYNFLIEGCCRAGKLGYATRFYQEMLQRGLLPSTHAFNQLLEEICEAGDVDKANDILTTALEKGLLPDEVTYAHLIDAYSKMDNVQEVLKLYHEMEYRGPAPGLLTHSLLVRSLCRCKQYDKAEKILSAMKEKSLIPSTYIYNCIIEGLCMSNNTGKAFQLYDEMRTTGAKPNSHTFAVLVEGMHRFYTLQTPEDAIDNLSSAFN
ncbi:pentatricopeptide repeat-containing protein At1g66345, mitochondrial [Nymphaea colorata]|nr:pentatricopeptide repeat-containing protein At1g66345, mitochondrial [Nymphaea colorata]XP_049936713.1 pentatricopeptide repeat-containing protein At1g66345, mitochondrial [Nymphaea colorata]XP_049936714.1 pentatricopeptide repeat-containing protein At1g66345, mitochondrial [Nymphaea colorata]XP_049936715.1 pentatricopeptide repeat-containing protein At1g66345, mitochondrial [Nymphaea colorata]XP_049936716.1 pentatricopeptide repeat-containing protein At1g66345, mitochondrial [Nymphaea color